MTCIFATFSSILYKGKVRMDQEYYMRNREWLVPFFERYHPGVVELYQDIDERLLRMSNVIQERYDIEVNEYKKHVNYQALLSKVAMHELYSLQTEILVKKKLETIKSYNDLPICGECGANPIIVELVRYTYLIYFVDGEMLFTKGGGKTLADALHSTPGKNLPQILINTFGV